MNRDNSILTEQERVLLGDRQADELIGGERWLAGRLGPAACPVPAGIQERLRSRVAGELSRQRARRRRWLAEAACAAAAAVLMVGLLVGLYRHGLIGRPVTPDASSTVVEAQQAVDAYVSAVGEVQQYDADQARIVREMALLDNALTAVEDKPWETVIMAEDNPWETVVMAIEGRGF